MSTKAIINNEFVSNKDSSAPFSSPVTELVTPIQALSFHVKFGVGVKGVMTWEGTNFPNEWIPVVNCDTIDLNINAAEAGSDIIALTGVWMQIGFLRFSWVPNIEGSSGLIDVSLRVVPT